MLLQCLRRYRPPKIARTRTVIPPTVPPMMDLTSSGVDPVALEEKPICWLPSRGIVKMLLEGQYMLLECFSRTYRYMVLKRREPKIY